MAEAPREYKFFRSFSAKVETGWPMRKAEQFWRRLRERKIAGRSCFLWLLTGPALSLFTICILSGVSAALITYFPFYLIFKVFFQHYILYKLFLSYSIEKQIDKIIAMIPNFDNLN